MGDMGKESENRMRLGIIAPSERHVSGADLRRIAEQAESAGYSTLWVSDHVVFPKAIDSQYPYGSAVHIAEDGFFLEALTTLAFLAGCTSSIGLGTDVLVAGLRRPKVAVKILGSLEHLARRELRIGLGSGWLREEYKLVGSDFESRHQLLDEVRNLIVSLRSDTERGASNDFRLTPAPGNLGNGSPVLLGGTSKSACRRAAEAFDGWVGVGLSIEELRERIEWIMEFSNRSHRDPNAFLIVTSGLVRVTESDAVLTPSSRVLASNAAEIARLLHEYESAGVGEYIIFPKTGDEPGWVDEYISMASAVAAAFLGGEGG